MSEKITSSPGEQFEKKFLNWLDHYFNNPTMEEIMVSDVPDIALKFLHEKFPIIDTEKHEITYRKIMNDNIYLCEQLETWDMSKMRNIFMVELDDSVVIGGWFFSEWNDWYYYVSNSLTIDNRWKRWFYWKRRLEVMNSISNGLYWNLLSSDWTFFDLAAKRRWEELVEEGKAEPYIYKQRSNCYRFK